MIVEPTWADLAREVVELLGGWAVLAEEGVWWVRVTHLDFPETRPTLLLSGEGGDCLLDLEHDGTAGALMSRLLREGPWVGITPPKFGHIGRVMLPEGEVATDYPGEHWGVGVAAVLVEILNAKEASDGEA